MSNKRTAQQKVNKFHVCMFQGMVLFIRKFFQRKYIFESDTYYTTQKFLEDKKKCELHEAKVYNLFQEKNMCFEFKFIFCMPNVQNKIVFRIKQNISQFKIFFEATKTCLDFLLGCLCVDQQFFQQGLRYSTIHIFVQIVAIFFLLNNVEYEYTYLTR